MRHHNPSGTTIPKLEIDLFIVELAKHRYTIFWKQKESQQKKKLVNRYRIKYIYNG